MTLKKDSNFEEKLTFCLKNDFRNFVNFNASSGKFENLLFEDYFWRKYVMFELTKYRVEALRTTYDFKNDISNLVRFHKSS